MTSTNATQQSYEMLIAAEPVLNRIAPLSTLVPNLAERTLFHAGPPFIALDQIPAPVRNAFAASAIHEGWADTPTGALESLAVGEIRLAPAQDIGLVTPLAFVVGPSVFCCEVVDANAPLHCRMAPLNDGPLPDALRFGTGRTEGLALLRQLTNSVGPDLARHVRASTPLLPLLAAGLAGGDDLHGHLAATQAELPGLFDDAIADDSRTFISAANQFVLNIVMATAALMIGAGAGVANSHLVVAAGGNGVELGTKLANRPDEWVTVPALLPRGPRFPGKESATALAAIGDSAVIDAAGFGAACLRFCPTLKQALDGHIDPAYFTTAAHAPFVGPHPALGDDSVHVGLDPSRPFTCRGIMLGMVEAGGKDGIIGRGVAPWPTLQI